MYYKDDWDESRSRFTALWQRELVDRCCIAVTAPRKDAVIKKYEYPNDYQGIVDAHINPELVLSRYLDTFDSTWFGGESIPCININFGPEAHAGYFGATATFTPETVWFEPIIHDWCSDRLVFDPNNDFYQQHRNLAIELAKRSNGRYFVSSSDNCSAIDCLAILRGTQALMYDFYDHPNKVREAQQVILHEWIQTERDFFRISKYTNGGSAQAWLQTWSAGYHTHIQCDLSVMISPALFDEFIVDELITMCDALDNSVYHMDGIEELKHLDSLLSIEKLDMIQWMNCCAQLPSSFYLPELKKIQQAGKALHLFCTPDEVPVLLENLSSKGLYLVTSASSEDEGKALIKLAQKLTHE